LLADSSVVSIP
jgi:hypothetical protein